jgi:hypothetical protein
VAPQRPTTRAAFRALAAVAPCVLFLVVAFGASAQGLASDSSISTCRGTLPNHVPGGAAFSRSQFNYGGANLRAHLNWKNGSLKAGILTDGGAMAIINPDGSIYAKQGWWRGKKGTLIVRGRRLDGDAPTFWGTVKPGYGETGFIPVGLTFPTTGCWRITGILGSAKLTYVVKVTKIQSS